MASIRPLLLHKVALLKSDLNIHILKNKRRYRRRLRPRGEYSNIGLLTSCGLDAGIICFDAMEELSQNTELAFLALSNHGYQGSWHYVGLLLRRVAGDDESAYR